MDWSESIENPLYEYSSILTLFCCCFFCFQCDLYQDNCELSTIPGLYIESTKKAALRNHKKPNLSP